MAVTVALDSSSTSS